MSFAFFIPQDDAAKAEENISRLNDEVKAEQKVRVSAEKKIEETEQALVTLSQENATLQLKLDEAQNKLETTEKELTSLRQMITQMLTAIVGESDNSVIILSRLVCLLYLLLY